MSSFQLGISSKYSSNCKLFIYDNITLIQELESQCKKCVKSAFDLTAVGWRLLCKNWSSCIEVCEQINLFLTWSTSAVNTFLITCCSWSLYAKLVEQNTVFINPSIHFLNYLSGPGSLWWAVKAERSGACRGEVAVFPPLKAVLVNWWLLVGRVCGCEKTWCPFS